MDTWIRPIESDAMSKKHGNRYSREFKEEAVRLLATSGKTAKELGRELGVSGMTLGTWREQAIRNGDHPNQAQLDGVRIHYSVLKLENERLKKEVQTLRQQREILKKSLGILSKEPSQKGMP
jgi:transposase